MPNVTGSRVPRQSLEKLSRLKLQSTVARIKDFERCQHRLKISSDA